MLIAAANVQEECPLNKLDEKNSQHDLYYKSSKELLHAYSNKSFVEDDMGLKLHVIPEEKQPPTHPATPEVDPEEVVVIIKAQIIPDDGDQHSQKFDDPTQS